MFTNDVSFGDTLPLLCAALGMQVPSDLPVRPAPPVRQILPAPTAVIHYSPMPSQASVSLVKIEDRVRKVTSYVIIDRADLDRLLSSKETMPEGGPRYRVERHHTASRTQIKRLAQQRQLTLSKLESVI